MDRWIRKINTSPRSKKKSGEKPRVFGTVLSNLVSATDNVHVPLIVCNICDYLLRFAIEYEGIFRVNGSARQIEAYRALFELSNGNELSSGGEYDAYAIAGVLKCFLRELKDGLVPEKFTCEFVKTTSNYRDDAQLCFNKLRRLLKTLPKANYDLLVYLVLFLSKVAKHESTNKMTPNALGIIFGPCVFRCPLDAQGIRNQGLSNYLMTLFIHHMDEIFFYSGDATGDFPGREELVAPPSRSVTFESMKEASMKISDSLAPVHLDNREGFSLLDHITASCNKLSLAPRRESADGVLGQLNHHHLQQLPTTEHQQTAPTSSEQLRPRSGSMHASRNNSSCFDRSHSHSNSNIPQQTQPTNACASEHLAREKEQPKVNRSESPDPEAVLQMCMLVGACRSAELQEQQQQQQQQQQQRLREKHQGSESQPSEQATNSPIPAPGMTEDKPLHTNTQNSGEAERSSGRSSSRHSSLLEENPVQGEASISHSAASSPSASSDRAPAKAKSTKAVDAMDGTVRGEAELPASLEAFCELLNAVLAEQRYRCHRPEDIDQMTLAQVEEEKLDLQKGLLYFEKMYGLPRSVNAKRVMKQLYDRYRLVKRIVRAQQMKGAEGPSGERASHASPAQSAETVPTIAADSRCVPEGGYAKQSISTYASELMRMDPGELQREWSCISSAKVRLQRRLRDFESQVQRAKGRRPMRSERDEVRSDYDEYRALKQRLAAVDLRMTDKNCSLSSLLVAANLNAFGRTRGLKHASQGQGQSSGAGFRKSSDDFSSPAAKPAAPDQARAAPIDSTPPVKLARQDNACA